MGATEIRPLILLFCALSASAAPDCATCHTREAQSHARTRHAMAMGPALGSLFAAKLPDHPLGEARDGYLFEYRRADKGLLVTAQRGNSRAEGLIEWVIGAGELGETPLVRTGKTWLESRVSYYSRTGRYGITAGQANGTSPNAQAALGKEQTAHEVQGCLGCHATVVSSDLEPLVAGIQCARCHTGAEDHARGNGKPLNPGKLAAEEQVRFCGACHRVKPHGSESDLENVRFQPLRLMKSRCFEKGRVSCTTCHAAHQDALRNAADSYNSKCMGCHAGIEEKEDCIGCHMPRVQLDPALSFTDHYIR